ncbi:transketolase [Klebsiella pneumoniae]|uniref:Transketolase n=1 Tax=Klebsiella pneumoniae TaxID=573 RepID=A0A377TPX5_KLEPN|nr:transketolase [Klebsiella pneumoniae]
MQNTWLTSWSKPLSPPWSAASIWCRWLADSTSTAKIAPFIKQFPGRLVNVGIAEQSMVGTAAGLALGGKVAVTCNAAAVSYLAGQ